MGTREVIDRRWFRKLWLAGFGFALLAACGGGDGEAEAQPASVGGAGGQAGTGGSAGTMCSADSDCAAKMPATTPAGCAVSRCDALSGKCVLSAKDQDGDGHPSHGCTTSSGQILDGDDCDDSDPSVNPAAWDGPEVNGLSSACDGVDSDCNGKVDDGKSAAGCTCTCCPDAAEPCDQTSAGAPIAWPAADGKPKGECKAGTRICSKSGAWGQCNGAVLPAPTDQCGDNRDNDCDGSVDEGCSCSPGQIAECTESGSGAPISWPGAPSTVGACHKGTKQCVNGAWGPCTGAAGPSLELCGDKVDNDCDGLTDAADTKDCQCTPGSKVECTLDSSGKPVSWPGAPKPLGECRPGYKLCSANGQYGPCTDTVGPTVEVCDGKDNNCDGVADANGNTNACLFTLTNIALMLHPLDEDAGSGDTDFNGNGPTVTINVTFSAAGSSVLVKGCVTMKETKSNYSSGSKCDTRTVSTPRAVKSITSQPITVQYTDTNQAADALNGALVGECVGDTAGPDICKDQPISPQGCSGCTVTVKEVKVILQP